MVFFSRTIEKRTGCLLPCSFKVYETQPIISEANFLRNWTSALYLKAEDSTVSVFEEKCIFELSSLISEMGGMMGLTLGWSFYGLITMAWTTLDNFVTMKK